MGSLDKLFLKIAGMSRWARQRLAFDSQNESERRIAKLTLKLDYPGQKRESNGQFGTGKKVGGSSGKVEKSSKSGTIGTSKRKLPSDSGGNAYSKPRARNISSRESSKISHEINTLYHAKFEGRRTGIITSYNPDDGQAYDYRFECHGFDEYNIYSKRRNRK